MLINFLKHFSKSNQQSVNILIKDGPKNLKAAEAHINLGRDFLTEKKYDQALDSFQTAIAVSANYPDAYNFLGIAYLETNQLDDAITAFQTAITLNPNECRYHANVGAALSRQDNLQGALDLFEYAVTFNPNSAEIYANLGGLLQNKDRLDEATTVLERAFAIDPNCILAHINLACVYNNLGKPQVALALLQKAKAIAPNNQQVNGYYALTLFCNEQIDSAIKVFEETFKDPIELTHVQWNYAIALLKNGNYEEGWKKYEMRSILKIIKDRYYTKRYASYPKLQPGNNIQGKTIIVFGEQGYGDVFQFIRYVPELNRRGAKVIVDCHKELQRILKSVEGISEIILADEPIPEFDFCTSLMSLPYFFNTTLATIPAQIPYIKPDIALVEKWKKELASEKKLKVGLVWAGSTGRYLADIGHIHIFRKRNLTLNLFAQLGNVKGVQLYSLQKGEQAIEAKTPPSNLNLIDYTEQFSDFADTAAFIANLDLIISVDTAVVHLAAAMDKPVWMLDRFAGCWRWLKDREDSPWYPSIYIFRQRDPNDWLSVISKIERKLIQWVEYNFQKRKDSEVSLYTTRT